MIRMFLEQAPQLLSCFSALFMGGDPSHPGDGAAQEWAREELAKNKYHYTETLLQKFVKWLGKILELSFGRIANGSTADLVAWILALLIAAICIFLLIKYIRTRRTLHAGEQSPHVSAPIFNDARSSAELLEAAQLALREHDDDLFVIETFRAVIRILEERTIIAVRPGLTATEAADIGARKLGSEELFGRSAQWFNRIYFADEHASQSALADLTSLAQHVRTAEPLLSHSAAEGGKA